MSDIVKAVENLTSLKANFKVIDKGNDLKVNIEEREPLFELLKINQMPIEQFIKKYKIV